MLAQSFNSANVKVTLFRAYCQNVYTGALCSWSYTQGANNAFRILYSDLFRMLLTLPRFANASAR